MKKPKCWAEVMANAGRKVGHIPPTKTKRPKIQYPKEETKEELLNLIIKEQVPLELKELKYSRWTMEQLLQDIQKYYIDKQRVKSIVKLVIMSPPIAENEPKRRKMQWKCIKKELRL